MIKFSKKASKVESEVCEQENDFVGNESSDNFVVIDGSLLAFRTAAAGEKRTIITTHVKSKRKKEFDNRTVFKEYLTEINQGREEEKQFKISDFEIEDVQYPPEPKITLHVLKESINYILTACRAKDYLIVLDNPDKTFRHNVATVQEYKGNRHNLIKPVNLQLVKDHMTLHYKTQIALDGYEGDDILNFYKFEGWNKTKKNKDAPKIITATFDKDDMGCVGWSFDFRKDDEGRPLMKHPIFIDGLGELYLNAKGDVKGRGRIWLYYQWVNQDQADNYKASKLSTKRFGDKAAYKLLSPLKTDKDCVQAVIDQFKEWYPSPVKYTSWDGKDMTKTYLELAQEYFDLARMHRWEGDHVDIKDMMDRLGVDYES